MTPDEAREARLRIAALQADMIAGRLRVAAACTRFATAMRALNAAFQAGMDRELATHPDIAELNVRLDALYDPPAGDFRGEWRL